LQPAGGLWHCSDMVSRNLTPVYVGWIVLLLTYPDIAVPFIGLYLVRVAWRQS
jgi:hypothetical protein